MDVAQLLETLNSRVWIEQAKGVLAATQGTDAGVAFQQLRARARASSRKLAEVAQEVVQDAQRQRLAAPAPDNPPGPHGAVPQEGPQDAQPQGLAALALDNARVRQAQARAQAAEQALEDAQADLTQH